MEGIIVLVGVMWIIYILFGGDSRSQAESAMLIAVGIFVPLSMGVIVWAMSRISDMIGDKWGAVPSTIFNVFFIVICLILGIQLFLRLIDPSHYTKEKKLYDSYRYGVLKDAVPSESARKYWTEKWYRDHGEYPTEDQLLEFWRDRRAKELAATHRRNSKSGYKGKEYSRSSIRKISGSIIAVAFLITVAGVIYLLAAYK